MLAVQPRRWLSRPKGLIAFALTMATLYWFLLHDTTNARLRSWYGESKVVPEQIPLGDTSDYTPPASPAAEQPITQVSQEELDFINDVNNPNSPAYFKPFEEHIKDAEDEREKSLRAQFKMEYEELGRQPGADAIYGQTMATLNTSRPRAAKHEAQLTPAHNLTYFSTERPQVYHPYPEYNKPAWLAEHARYVPCVGPTGEEVSDIMVFKGTPEEFPVPQIGSYKALDMDGDLCFERETRFGMYGFQNANETMDQTIDWANVRWGALQEKCVQKNSERFDMQGKSNPYITTVYPRGDMTLAEDVDDPAVDRNSNLRRAHVAGFKRGPLERLGGGKSKDAPHTEPRTALLLRTYTGKEYNENDKQAIRALITELSLRTGGQYQVFLFVHVKDTSYAIWDDEPTYQYVLEQNVPQEFRDIAILWNDEATQSMYPKLDPQRATVHTSQWLSVQKFIQEFPEFEYVWNWEMDARVTGHHYDFLEKLSSFARRQPRRGLWERNERYYIPDVHGDYDTEFRKQVERISGDETIWGPLDMPFINPVGPKPPVKDPKDDNYKWGVGEEADLITVAPIWNVKDSGWVGGEDVWNYSDPLHPTQSLPRRATIVTHSRISKRLLDIMHVENLRGNHITSEMACQTVSMLHGLKTVYAPMPIYFDRPWEGKDIARWFNSGRKGESGGHNSAMGWGREARYGGTTWYYRATPPQRMYNNMLGYEDNGIGGVQWEAKHGRTCLPAILMHPIKDVEPTGPGYKSESILPFG